MAKFRCTRQAGSSEWVVIETNVTGDGMFCKYRNVLTERIGQFSSFS